MSKLSSVLAGTISRRWYGVQARAVNIVQVQATTTDGVGATAAAVADGGKDRAVKKEVFWMRHPKTGCWLPENRFDDEVDAAELRKQLLGYK